MTASASAILPINSPRVIRLFYWLRWALDVVNDCCELLIIINDGGKDEDPQSYNRQTQPARTETYRIRINGEVTQHSHRLEEYLRKKLIGSGWKENLKNYCKGKR
jgi:hypothetical protein